MQKQITPDELRELRDEYGLSLHNLKPKKKKVYSEHRRDSRSWKDQTKHRNQYK